MKRGKKELNSNNTKFAVLFFVFITCVIILSLIFKGFSLIRKSKFDNSHRFTINVSSGKNFEIVSFSPKSSTISILRLNGGALGVNLKRTLAVYTDGEINFSFADLDKENVTLLLFKTLVNFNKIKTNLTAFDIVRLLFFAKTVPASQIITKDIALNLTSAEMDKISAPLLVDVDIEKDNKTVEVINGTDVVGLGNWLSRFLTNIGCNIVLVSTSDSPVETSTISYFGKKTYTVERLEKMLGFKTVKRNEQAIADIIILIGRDGISSLPL